MKGLQRPQLLQILFWCILSFHVFITAHAFYTFGIGVQSGNYESYHAYALMLYTVLWLVACFNRTTASVLYIALSLAQFIISNFATNPNVKTGFGSTLFPIDLIFCAVLILDVLSKIKKNK